MASLFNTRISDTYSGLIKTIDNAALTASLKELTDGSGLSSGLYMNNAGDFKVTAILEFGSLKDTGENIIISKFVDAADGIGNNDNDTTIPTTAAIIDYVAAQITIEDLDFTGDTGSGQIDLDSQIFAIGGTTNEITTVASGQSLSLSLDSTGVYLPDNSTAITQTAGDNSTKIATTSYVDTLDAASDLDFSGDSGTGDVNLNTQRFSITGVTNTVVTTASNQGLSVAFDPNGVILPNNSTATTQSAGDNSTKIATTEYVKSLNNASLLNFTTDSGSGNVILNSQVLSVLGTANEIEVIGAGQIVRIGLPSSISTNLVGNVTGNVQGDVVGDLTGNADTATAWETARDLSLTGQATGTISSVDGTNNVSGAVTLDNNSVTGKVLTGLTSPSASSVLATDTIVEGFGKLQSQVNGLAGGLRFMGSWDADTNSPVLGSGGGEAANGTTTATTAKKLVDSSASFTSTVTVGDQVVNQVDGQTALVSNIDSNTTLSLDADIMLTGEAYTIDNSPFITQGHYYVVSVGGTTTLNGISNWTIGDWVIAGANNQWTKLDHSQVDGTGTTGNLTKWSSTSVIADSIVSESGSAITVDGSLTTNTNLTSTGNFQVGTGTGFFTVNATTGNGFFEGEVETGRKITIADLNYPVLIGKHIAAGNGDILLSIQGQSDNTLYSQIRLTQGTATYGSIDFVTKKSGGLTNSVQITNDTGDLKLLTGILEVSGTGTSTFGGDVTVTKSGNTLLNIQSTNDNAIIKIDANSGGTGSTNNQDPYLQFASGNTIKANIHYDNTATNLIFQTNTNATALTIDNSQNSTFAGDVTAPVLIAGSGTPKGATGSVLKLSTASGNTRASFTSESTTILDFGNQADFDNGGILYDNVGKKMTFKTNANTRLTIDSSGKVGIGTDSPSNYAKLNVVSSTQYEGIVFGNGTNDVGWISGTSAANDNGQLSLSSAGVQKVQINANSNSYFNGGNVGIGTTSPNVKTHIFGGSDSQENVLLKVQSNGVANDSSLSTSILLANSTALTSIHGAKISAIRTGSGTDDLAFYTYNTSMEERMRIDSAGNVGIGTDSPTRPLTVYSDVGATNILGVFDNSGTTAANCLIAFSDPNSTAGQFSTRLGSVGDALAFYTNGANERMRIDSSGNVGISIDSPSAKLHIKSPANARAIKLQNLQNNSASYILWLDELGAEKSFIGNGTSAGGDADELVFGTNAVERMRIDSSGVLTVSAAASDIATFKATGFGQNEKQLIIGSGGDRVILDAQTTTGATTDFAFETGGTERMRITSGGNIDINSHTGANVGYGLRFFSHSGYSQIYQEADTTTTRIIQRFYNPSGNVGNISMAGTSTSYATSSDYRLKEDLQDFAGLDMVSKIPVYDFKWKSDESRSYGVMAHELQKVLPDAVTGEKDAEEMQGVDYSKIVPLLVKSIQELKAEVDKLKQECKCKN